MPQGGPECPVAYSVPLGMAVDAALHTMNESVDEKKGHVKAAAYIDDIAVMVPSTRANEAEEILAEVTSNLEILNQKLGHGEEKDGLINDEQRRDNIGPPDNQLNRRLRFPYLGVTLKDDIAGTYMDLPQRLTSLLVEEIKGNWEKPQTVTRFHDMFLAKIRPKILPLIYSMPESLARAGIMWLD